MYLFPLQSSSMAKSYFESDHFIGVRPSSGLLHCVVKPQVQVGGSIWPRPTHAVDADMTGPSGPPKFWDSNELTFPNFEGTFKSLRCLARDFRKKPVSECLHVVTLKGA